MAAQAVAMKSTPPVVLVSLLVLHASEMHNCKGAIDALATLAKSDFRDRADGRIVTLINGMGAGPFTARSEASLAMFGQCLVVPQNIGIAAGRNHILRQVVADGWEPEYVLEIHNDMVFPRTWFEPLLHAMRTLKGQGALGPALITPHGYFGGPRLILDRGQETDRLQADVTLAAAKYRQFYAERRPRTRRGLSHPVLKAWPAMVEAGGPFYDEANFPGQNFEDTDEVWRLEAAGYRVSVCLDSFVYHHYHASRLGVDPGSYGRNLEAFSQKYGAEAAASWLRQWQQSLETMYAVEAVPPPARRYVAPS